MHEHRIAHLVSGTSQLNRISYQTLFQDITANNILIACHPSFRMPRILLTDFEFSRHFPIGEEPHADLPWFKYRKDKPPEGIQVIDAFAFDMYNIGRLLYGVVARVRVQVVTSAHTHTHLSTGREIPSFLSADSMATEITGHHSRPTF